VVFACNWCGWSSVEAAVNGGRRYPASVEVLKVSCLSRVHAGLMLKAFELGAAGVMLLGCEPYACHFGTSERCVAGEFGKAQALLSTLGIAKERLVLVQLPAYSGDRFVEELTRLLETPGVATSAVSAHAPPAPARPVWQMDIE